MLVGIDEGTAVALGLGTNDAVRLVVVFVINPDDVVVLGLDGAVFDAYAAIITTATITTPKSSRAKKRFIEWSFLVSVLAKRWGKCLM
jgi:hypothetical protein